MTRIIHTGTTTIFTDRLILRKFSESDAKNSYVNWLSDKKSISFIDLPFIHGENLFYSEKFISDIVNSYKNNFYCFAIEIIQTREIIGSIQLNDLDEYIKKCEVGFVLGSEFWQQGYMTEALNTILDFAFNTLKFNRVEGYCTPQNIASENVLKKCNLKYEGTLKDRILIRNKYFPGKLYSITKNDFNKKSKRDF